MLPSMGAQFEFPGYTPLNDAVHSHTRDFLTRKHSDWLGLSQLALLGFSMVLRELRLGIIIITLNIAAYRRICIESSIR
ncbi:uncharacterized protein AFUA_2G07860 [Aspergillus fumigatus Af293]|uniref:Uncharacterized protein n=2 Tax=Aspergillus fumigatus TaxID=746128 RepID=Q4X232_ASPFU|nr:hypothetical protein AFUA_2G07860 [Aspergillus fumigatus Af293]EAL93083.1 hypothetical protein AFUA_2G07860 [Aspergillus fumigatus Af293]EDP54332.1 hypothetical protein AFUB_023880 [Aspergillus fumigatus A1163]